MTIINKLHTTHVQARRGGNNSFTKLFLEKYWFTAYVSGWNTGNIKVHWYELNLNAFDNGVL
jgi:hypothetical protein